MDLILRARKEFFNNSETDDISYVTWLYKMNPAGPLYGCYLLDEDTIAGQYINIPIAVVVNGALHTASYSLHTFTHHDYRRQGVFIRMATELFQHISEGGCVFTIGMPNNLSRPGFIDKLGFVEPFSVLSYIRPMTIHPQAGRLTRKVLTNIPFGWIPRLAKKVNSLEFHKTSNPDSQWVDALWESIVPSVIFGLHKDSRWLYWRYIDNPTSRYAFLTATRKDGMPGGYVVWKTERCRARGFSFTYIMDIVSTDWLTAAALIQTFFDEIAMDYDLVRAIAPIRNALSYLFVTFGFVPVKKCILYLSSIC